MFLTASNLVHYLIERDTVDINSLMDGQFMVIEAGRRNRNFKVFQKADLGLFIKQIKAIDPIENATLRREAECYRLAQQYADWSALMPRFVDHDPARHCLTVGLLDAAENLTEFHWRLQQFPTTIGELLGDALGRFHQITSDHLVESVARTLFPKRIPWIFAFHRDNNRVSEAVISLGEIVRKNENLHLSMDRLRDQWRFSGVIHGDTKWDNCVVYMNASNQQCLKIVDWELVDFGDCAWDFGGVLHSYLAHWIAMMPFAKTTNKEELIQGSNVMLMQMQPAMQAFWAAYSKTCNLNGSAQRDFLKRALDYVAARLLQTAFEYSYYASQISEHVLMLVHISQTILNDPQTAAQELFGFEMENV